MKPFVFRVVMHFESGDKKTESHVAYHEVPQVLNNYLVASEVMGNRLISSTIDLVESGKVIKYPHPVQ